MLKQKDMVVGKYYRYDDTRGDESFKDGEIIICVSIQPDTLNEFSSLRTGREDYIYPEEVKEILPETVKVGAVCRYNDCYNEHEFEVGELVKVVNYSVLYRCQSLLTGKTMAVSRIELDMVDNEGSRYSEDTLEVKETEPIQCSPVDIGLLEKLGTVGKVAQEPDMVNHPPHYTRGKVETIDGLESAVEGLSGKEAGLTWQVMKYMWRWKFKGNPKEDLKKAKWYLERLISYVSDGENNG